VKRLVFAFVLGAVVGGFAAMVAVTGSAFDSEPTAPATTAEPAIDVKPTRVAPRAAVMIEPDKDDEGLAMELDQAHFDRDWQRVRAVGRVLRGRPASSDGTIRAGSAGGDVRGSLLQMDYEYRRRVFLLELGGHDNRATRVMEETDSVQEQERRLTDLFMAPTVAEGDAIVVRDAAFLIGQLATEGGRQLLVRTLKDPEAARADLAAEALGRSGDPQAASALLSALEGDLDPKLRARAAHALAYTRDLAAGGQIAVKLADAAQQDQDVGVRSHALAALARADLRRCLPARNALSLLLEDENETPILRQASVAAMRSHRAIAKTLPEELVISLERVLPKATGPLKLEVTRALGEAGRAETVPILENALLAASAPEEQEELRRAIEAVKKRTQEQ